MDETALKGLLIEAKKQALKKGFPCALSATGLSMLPLIKGTDRIIVVACDKDELKPGDLIIYQADYDENIMVAHRFIWRLNKNLIIAKGDARMRCDEPFDANLVMGRVIRVKKPHFSICLDNPAGEALNVLMLFISLTRFIAVWMRVRNKIKRLLKIRNNPF
jgi:hypothetical protein